VNTGLEMDSMAQQFRLDLSVLVRDIVTVGQGTCALGSRRSIVGRGQHELRERAADLLEEAGALGRDTVELGHVWPLKMDTGALTHWLKAAFGGSNV